MFVWVLLDCTPVLGSAGYIVANCVNMLCRCIHHLHYIRGVVSPFSLTMIMPSLPWLSALLAAGCGLAYEESVLFPYSLRRLLIHLLVGITTGVAMLGAVVVCDRPTLQKAKELLWKNKREWRVSYKYTIYTATEMRNSREGSSQELVWSVPDLSAQELD